jgi:hypothetical protein
MINVFVDTFKKKHRLTEAADVVGKLKKPGSIEFGQKALFVL